MNWSMNWLQSTTAALALVAGTVLVPTLANAEETADCVPSDGTPDTLAAWEAGGFTAWQASGLQPHDPDGQSGQDNPLNLVELGERVEQQVGNGDGTPATEVFDHWQRYSLVGGAWGAGVPAFPDPGAPFRWQDDVAGDPHGVGAAGAYDRSNEHTGNTDWFYLEGVTRTVPGQTETFHTEYRWVVQQRGIVAGTDPVLCPPDEEEPGEEECPDGQVGTPPSCDDGDDDGGDDGGDDGSRPPLEETGTPPAGGQGGGHPTRPPVTSPSDDTPMIETPGPGEEIVFQSFDERGNLVEQRVAAPIPAQAQQEGM